MTASLLFPRSLPDCLPGAGRAGSAAALRSNVQLAAVSTERRVRRRGRGSSRGGSRGGGSTWELTSRLSLVVVSRCSHALCLFCSHFQTVETAVKEDALELMTQGGYLLFLAE